MRVTVAVVLSSLAAVAVASAQPSTSPTASAGSGSAGSAAAGSAAAGSAAAGSAAAGSAAPAAGSGSAATTGTDAAIDPATVPPESMPTAVRIRRVEQRTQALKERAWQLKARVQMLKEQVVGGGVGAQSLIAHSNAMGGSFKLIKLSYVLDGSEVFSRADDTGALAGTKSFDIYANPISPGSHNISVEATYRGHGYGVLSYLTKYTFIARGGTNFVVSEGRTARVTCRGFEKGGAITPIEERPAIECTAVQSDSTAAPGPTPMAPASPTSPTPAATPTPAPAATTPAPTPAPGT